MLQIFEYVEAFGVTCNRLRHQPSGELSQGYTVSRKPLNEKTLSADASEMR